MMTGLRIERAAFDSASQAVSRSGQVLGQLRVIEHGNLGGESLKNAADEAGFTWSNTGRALAETVLADGRQLSEVNDAFTRADDGLAALAESTGRK